MMKVLPLVTAFAVVLFSGVTHGLRTGRWKVSDDLRQAVVRLQDVPTQVGDWEAQEEEMAEPERQMAEIDGYRKLSFVNRVTRAQVQFLIVCGKPGPISVHTPNICYIGIG